MPLCIRAAKFLYMNVFELMIRDNTMNILDNTVSTVIKENDLFLHLVPQIHPVCETFEKSPDVGE
jgi:hypothetical protein